MKISASFLNAKERIKELDNTNISYIHCDIMDGAFVKNSTSFFSLLEDINKDLKHELDIHLMVENIYPYISIYSSLKPKYLTFHLEIGDTLDIISTIKSHNIEVGISLRPETPVEELIPFLDKVDLVLIMSVEPGAGGQKFLESAVQKMTFLKQYREENKLDYLIEVDGGVNDETIKKCSDADIVVVGNYITQAENFSEKVDTLMEVK